jgi:membrane associated rhomboid family serine protease
MIGASGAIAGVLGGYLVLYPRARVLTVVFIVLFFTLLEVPAALVLGFWFLQQAIFAWFGLTDAVNGAGGVAYFAHVGGFVCGLVLIKLLRARVNPAYTRYLATH